MNGQLKIERGIPLPDASRKGRTWGLSGVLRKMKPKESVLVTEGDPQCTSRTASYVGKATGFKFVTRRCQEGVRIWRVT